MEQFLGRRLGRNEYVHHRNGNTLDNRMENLELVDAATHTRRHSEEYKASMKGWGCGRRIAEGMDYWTDARRAVMTPRRMAGKAEKAA